mmetsp:Transcript_27846/g.51256  ORF Transcript_27846/g.51256 Transcript_27846/m.51256 type:complete len:268 (+) Transcript_27846:83-886(+)
MQFPPIYTPTPINHFHHIPPNCHAVFVPYPLSYSPVPQGKNDKNTISPVMNCQMRSQDLEVYHHPPSRKRKRSYIFSCREQNGWYSTSYNTFHNISIRLTLIQQSRSLHIPRPSPHRPKSTHVVILVHHRIRLCQCRRTNQQREGIARDQTEGVARIRRQQLLQCRFFVADLTSSFDGGQEFFYFVLPIEGVGVGVAGYGFEEFAHEGLAYCECGLVRGGRGDVGVAAIIGFVCGITAWRIIIGRGCSGGGGIICIGRGGGRILFGR